MLRIFALTFLALTLSACAVDEADAFVGAYQNTITVSGMSSQTYTDSVSIVEGETSDLIIQSQQLGSLRATILNKGAFSIDQQQITLTSPTGGAFSVTIMGQGTVVSGVFNASGQLSSSTGALGFTMTGQKL